MKAIEPTIAEKTTQTMTSCQPAPKLGTKDWMMYVITRPMKATITPG
jgi:hypothetical protein